VRAINACGDPADDDVLGDRKAHEPFALTINICSRGVFSDPALLLSYAGVPRRTM